MDDLEFERHLSKAGRVSPRPLAAGAAERLVSSALVRAGHRRSWWRRPLLIVPAIGIIAATTAGALAFTATINADITIPITYTTESGQDVSCNFAVQVGAFADSDPAAMKAFVVAHDWSDLGQRAYAYALEHRIPATLEHRYPDSRQQGFTQEEADDISFFAGMERIFWSEIPDRFADDIGANEDTDCTGILK